MITSVSQPGRETLSLKDLMKLKYETFVAHSMTDMVSILAKKIESYEASKKKLPQL